MENIIKQGYLECYVRGIPSTSFHWSQRYYVLYGATANSQSRLDYYEDEEAFKDQPKFRKTIYLEQVEKADPETNPLRTHCFVVRMARSEKRDYIFAAATRSEMESWISAIDHAQQEDSNLHPASTAAGGEGDAQKGRIMVDQNDIYESAEDFQQYTVEVQETEAARRCHLQIGQPYELYVLSEFLCLADKNRRILSWNYKHIRRYGCGGSNFTFEAGRKSNSGEGLFSFNVALGEKLFKNVQERMRHMQLRKNTDKDEFNKLLLAGANTTTEAPSLPERHYSTGEETGSVSKPPPPTPQRRGSAGKELPAALNGGTTSGAPQPPPPTVKPRVAPKSTPATGSGFMSELNSKLSRQPPMLRPRGPPTTAAVATSSASDGNTATVAAAAKGAAQRPLPVSPASRVSTGENYELAKSNLPSATRRAPLPNYAETSEARELDPSYSDKKAAGRQPCTEPDYAVYDVAGSSRFQGAGSASQPAPPPPPALGEYSYCEPTVPDIRRRSGAIAGAGGNEPVYDDPAEAEVEPPKMSALIARLNKTKLQVVSKNDEEEESEYDHVNTHWGPAGRRLAAGLGSYDDVVELR